MILSILKEVNFQKKWLWLNGFLPAAFLVFDWLGDNLGANKPEAVIRTTGVISILFLLLSLAITPVVQLFRWNWLIKHRRCLGLLSFYYAGMHFFSYSIFDKGLNLNEIVIDTGKRPFIFLGITSFLLMIPLALTSTNKMITRIGGKGWRKLHRLSYVIMILTAIHYWMIVKSDFFYPYIVAIFAALFLMYRIIKKKLY